MMQWSKIRGLLQLKTFSQNKDNKAVAETVNLWGLYLIVVSLWNDAFQMPDLFCNPPRFHLITFNKIFYTAAGY